MSDISPIAFDAAADPLAGIRYAQARMRVLDFRLTLEGSRNKDSAREWVQGFGRALVRAWSLFSVGDG
jgi:hypothetical protein